MSGVIEGILETSLFCLLPELEDKMSITLGWFHHFICHNLADNCEVSQHNMYQFICQLMYWYKKILEALLLQMEAV